jgi:ubiquitin-protein ligase
MNENSRAWKRLMKELELLTTDSNVQSYFHYENFSLDEESKNYYIYGYLLPRLEPHKYGSYKVCIIIRRDFPFHVPYVRLLTYFYHPVVSNIELEMGTKISSLIRIRTLETTLSSNTMDRKYCRHN